MLSTGATEVMVEVVAEVGLARGVVVAVVVVAWEAEVAVEVAMEKGAEEAGAPGAVRSRHSRCPACIVAMGVQSCVGRSRCNRCSECRLSTPNQGRHRHRCHCSPPPCSKPPCSSSHYSH